MCHSGHESIDKPGNNAVEQITLYSVTIAYQSHGTELLELDIPAKGGEQVVSDGGFAAHLKILDVADLLDGAMVLLYMPVLVVLGGEGLSANGGQFVVIGQENRIMAWLVFQPRPKQFHVTEVFEPNSQAVIGDVERLHLRPLAFVHGHEAVAFEGEQPTQCVFSHALQVVHATVPAVTGYESRFQSPDHDVFQHVAKVVVLGFAFRLVVDAEIDGQMLPVGVRIVERDEVDALHGTVVLA